jgi:hypothetical protein
MGAEVALFSRVIFGVYENGVVGTSSHACLAANADRFVEIDNPIGAFKHSGGGTGGDAWRVSALIATCHLMCPTCLRKHS